MRWISLGSSCGFSFSLGRNLLTLENTYVKVSIMVKIKNFPFRRNVLNVYLYAVCFRSQLFTFHRTNLFSSYLFFFLISCFSCVSVFASYGQIPAEMIIKKKEKKRRWLISWSILFFVKCRLSKLTKRLIVSLIFNRSYSRGLEIMYGIIELQP